jgi:serine/threonine-protein kinase RsbW
VDSDLVLEIPSDVREIEEAVEFVMGRCTSCASRARKLRLNFRVGLTEALANAMVYGNSEDPAKRVRVEVRLSPACITARVIDQGVGFDPRSVPDPTSPENLCRPGGRGLFLMRKLLDEVHYNDRGNCVTLVLRFDPANGGAATA